MSGFLLGGIGATMSLVGSLFGNSSKKKQAIANYKNNENIINRDYSINTNTLNQEADSINEKLGLDLSSIAQTGDLNQATVVSELSERNIYGNTASRKIDVQQIKQSLASDVANQNAEVDIRDINFKIQQAGINREVKHSQNVSAFNSAMDQQHGALEIIADSFSAGLSGFAQGTNLSNSLRRLK